MTIIARIIFVLILWICVYHLVGTPDPLPSYIEPWGD